MPTTISQRELRNDSGEVLRRVEAGETFVVTRNGNPLAALSPLRRHVFVGRDELTASAAHLPSVDSRRFRRDVDSILDQRP